MTPNPDPRVGDLRRSDGIGGGNEIRVHDARQADVFGAFAQRNLFFARNQQVPIRQDFNHRNGDVAGKHIIGRRTAFAV